MATWVQLPSDALILNENSKKKVGENMSEVCVKYSDFLNSITDEISFELLTDVILKLKYNPEHVKGNKGTKEISIDEKPNSIKTNIERINIIWI